MRRGGLQEKVMKKRHRDEAAAILAAWKVPAACPPARLPAHPAALFYACAIASSAIGQTTVDTCCYGYPSSQLIRPVLGGCAGGEGAAEYR